MSKGIRVSEKHGVNPSLMVCPICHEDTGVALLGKLKGDEEAPRHILDQEPCETCRERMEGHVALIECMDNRKEPHRTGLIVWVRKGVLSDVEAVSYIGQENLKNLLGDNYPKKEEK